MFSVMAKELKNRMVRVKCSVQQQVDRRVSKHQCVACGKPLGDRKTRGCDPACYRALKRLVDAGKETEVSLIKKGFWLPAGTPGPEPTNAAIKRLNAEAC